MDENIPFVEISVNGFTSWQLTLVLRNIGSGPALVQKLMIADEIIEMGKVSVATGETVRVKLNLLNKKIVNSKIENPKVFMVYKNLQGKEFATKASIGQTERADGKFNVGRIEDCELVPDTLTKESASEQVSKMPQSYDVALSYASEDREYVEEVYKALQNEGITTFFDRENSVEIEMWGNNLLGYLQGVFGAGRVNYCVIFVSPVYQEKAFAVYELENAMASSVLSKKKDYILPVMLEGNELPSPVIPTTKYIDARNGKVSPEQLAKMIAVKIGREKTSPKMDLPIHKMPRVPQSSADPNSDPVKVVAYLVKELKNRGKQLDRHGIVLTTYNQEGKEIVKLASGDRSVFHLAIWLGGMAGGDGISFFQWNDRNYSGNNSTTAYGSTKWDKERNAYVIEITNFSLFKEIGTKYVVTPPELADMLWDKIIEEIERDYENSRR